MSKTTAIVVCKCGDSPKFAEEAFRLQFPNLPFPNVIAGKDALRDFIASIHQDSKAYRFLKNISGKYMYYIEFSDDEITLLQSLRDGRRLI